jgi:hypothetical protein
MLSAPRSRGAQVVHWGSHRRQPWSALPGTCVLSAGRAEGCSTRCLHPGWHALLLLLGSPIHRVAALGVVFTRVAQGAKGRRVIQAVSLLHRLPELSTATGLGHRQDCWSAPSAPGSHFRRPKRSTPQLRCRSGSGRLGAGPGFLRGAPGPPRDMSQEVQPACAGGGHAQRTF